jgi:hypothetical protein
MISQAEFNDIEHHLAVANDDERVAITIATETLRSLYLDLLAYREAERKANSWDDAPEWALSRQRVTETFCYTDALPGMYQGNARRSYLSREAMGKVEGRPK